MWIQALTAEATEVDQQMATMLGGAFVDVQGWDFGQIVDLVNVAAAIPALGSATATIPTLGNVTIEV